MSQQHFMNKQNAEDVLTPYANEIKKQRPISITYDNYMQLTEQEKTAHRYIITDYPNQDNNMNNIENLEGLRTDRRLIWHDEFNTFDNTKWTNHSFKINELIDNTNPEVFNISNSIFHAKTIETTDASTGTKKYIKGRIISRESFRNCLIEVKSRGAASFWAEALQFSTNHFKTANIIGGTRYHHWVEFDIAEYYLDDNLVPCQNFNAHVGTTNTNTGEKQWGKPIYEIDNQWHIYGLELVNERHFKFYKDRVLIKEVQIPADGHFGEGNDLVFGYSALKDFGINLILDSPSYNAAFTEDWHYQVDYDWVRVYANENDNNYIDRANFAMFMNQHGILCDAYLSDAFDITNPESPILTAYLKFFPENSYICPEIKDIRLYIDNKQLRTIHTKESSSLDNYDLSENASPYQGVYIEVETGIGIYRIYTYNNITAGIGVKLPVPYFLSTLDPTSETGRALYAELYNKISSPTSDYLFAIKDITTGKQHFLMVANGMIYGISQDTVEQFIGG